MSVSMLKQQRVPRYLDDLLVADQAWLVDFLQDELPRLGDAKHTARCRRILQWLGHVPRVESNAYEDRLTITQQE